MKNFSYLTRQKLEKKFPDDAALTRKIYEEHREDHVQYCIKKYKDFFDTVEKNPLTQKQRESCVTMERNNLVLAGAGTGKTSVMVARTGYLLKSKQAKPEDILLITFSTKAKKELEERIKRALDVDVKIKTFHGLGREIITEVERERLSTINAEKDQDFIRYMKNECSNLPIDFQVKYLDEYYKEKAKSEFGSGKEYFRYVDDKEFYTYNQEQVKSYNELRIANYLFVNNIKYKYESPYYCELTGTTIYPDFYLPDYDVYIEFYGINKGGGTRSDIDESKYKADMKFKQNLYAENNVQVIELFYSDAQNNVLYEQLKKGLNKLDPKVGKNPRTKEEIGIVLKKHNVLKIIKDDVWDALLLIRQFNVSVEWLAERTSLFEGVVDLLPKYEAYLKERNAIDFAEMIHRAIGYIENNSYTPQWKHILVDEFQDTSDIQADFIKLLRDKCGGSHLLCVGDDWQSIYRFQGGNIGLITNFEKHFGYSYQIALDKTFRFNQNVQDISSAFVTKNPNQLKKQMTSFSPAQHESVHLAAVDKVQGVERHNYKNAIEKSFQNKVWEILDNITQKHSADNKPSVMILARRNDDLEPLANIKHKDIDIKCMTIHGSKGLEADYVIIVGLRAGRFPSTIDDGLLAYYLLPKKESYPCAEECRLLYVALTRCKHEVWMVYNDNDYKSWFIDEIEQVKEQDNNGENEPKSGQEKSLTLKDILSGKYEQPNEEPIGKITSIFEEQKITSIFAEETPVKNEASTLEKNKLIDMGFWINKPSLEDVQKEIDNGADVNATNEYGGTPLTHATYQNNDEIVKLLIYKGADVNATTKDGWTPLMYVAEYSAEYSSVNALKIIELLVGNGADVNAKNNDGKTVFDLIDPDDGNYIEKIKVLKKASAKAKNAIIGNKLIDREFCSGEPTIEDINRTINEVLDVNGTNDHGYALYDMYAKEMASEESRKKYLDKTGNIILVNKLIDYEFWSEEPSFEDVKKLIDGGADVNDTDKHEKTPLMYAAGNSGADALKIVELLIGKGANVNGTDYDGNTTLIYAVPNFGECGFKIVELLIENGVNVNAKNNDGETVFDLINPDYKNNKEKIKVLEKATTMVVKEEVLYLIIDKKDVAWATNELAKKWQNSSKYSVYTISQEEYDEFEELDDVYEFVENIKNSRDKIIEEEILYLVIDKKGVAWATNELAKKWQNPSKYSVYTISQEEYDEFEKLDDVYEFVENIKISRDKIS